MCEEDEDHHRSGFCSEEGMLASDDRRRERLSFSQMLVLWNRAKSVGMESTRQSHVCIFNESRHGRMG